MSASALAIRHSHRRHNVRPDPVRHASPVRRSDEASPFALNSFPAAGLCGLGRLVSCHRRGRSGWGPRNGKQSGRGVSCAFAGGLSLGASLPITKAKLRPGATLRFVALGSSSTTGFGAFSKGTAFPDVMKGELLRLHPDIAIELVNSGRIGEDLGDNIARIDNDVLRYKPDLVIWQIGTNDVVWRGIADNAQGMLADAVKRIKAAKTDVVLLDLQYAPLVTLTSRYERMEKLITNVAAEQRVGHFPRFVMMKRAIDAGVSGLVSWDGLHNSSEGYRVRRRGARPHDRRRRAAIVRG